MSILCMVKGSDFTALSIYCAVFTDLNVLLCTAMLMYCHSSTPPSQRIIEGNWAVALYFLMAHSLLSPMPPMLSHGTKSPLITTVILPTIALLTISRRQASGYLKSFTTITASHSLIKILISSLAMTFFSFD